MKNNSIVFLYLITVFMSFSAQGIGIRIEATSGGILEDAILIASENGAPIRDAVALGDIDLSLTEHVFDVAVDPATTHWWLIGHESGNIVYTSLHDLNGVDLFDVEPYDSVGPFPWNIPANLDGYVNGTGFSLDWWAQTVSNHASHVTADGDISRLWLFESPGSNRGLVAVDLHFIPLPAALWLFCSGIVGLVGIARRRETT